MTIKLVTFKTNHTIIADITVPENNAVYVKEPLQVVTQPTKDGSGIVFVPFVEYAEEFKTGFKISMDNVLMISTPVKELEDNYRQVFSRIQIASMMPKV